MSVVLLVGGLVAAVALWLAVAVVSSERRLSGGKCIHIYILIAFFFFFRLVDALIRLCRTPNVALDWEYASDPSSWDTSPVRTSPNNH